jgi:hypothetical protein
VCPAAAAAVLPQVALAASTEQLPEKLIALREALTTAAFDSSDSPGSSSDGDSSSGANVSQLVARHPQILRHEPQQLQALVHEVGPA